jgi:hypothetical protein
MAQPNGQAFDRAAFDGPLSACNRRKVETLRLGITVARADGDQDQAQTGHDNSRNITMQTKNSKGQALAPLVLFGCAMITLLLTCSWPSARAVPT